MRAHRKALAHSNGNNLKRVIEKDEVQVWAADNGQCINPGQQPRGCHHLILKGKEHTGEPGGSDVSALRMDVYSEFPIYVSALLLHLTVRSGGDEN